MVVQSSLKLPHFPSGRLNLNGLGTKEVNLKPRLCNVIFQPCVCLVMDVYLSVTVRTGHHVTDRPGHVTVMGALILTPVIPIYRLLISGVDLDVK